MIERLCQGNELSIKRWRYFKSKRLAFCCSLIFLLSLLLTFCSPFVANSKPLIFSYKGEIFLPVLIDYEAKKFGFNDLLIPNYREIPKENIEWSLWPPISWNPYESNESLDDFPGAPSSQNLLGTDDRGRDVLTRLIYGYKYSIIYAVCVWLISFGVGTVFGAIMGFFGGRVDLLGQRIVEILSTTPQFFLLIILISLFTPNIFWLIVVSCLFSWIPISYYIRGEFLKNRKKEFVEAAQGIGNGSIGIIFKHILPNSLTPIITFSPFVIAGNIISLASLDYLGFGLPIPTPSWGELLAQAQKNYTIAWWLAVYPSLAIFVTLLGLNIIGEGIRDSLNPKSN